MRNVHRTQLPGDTEAFSDASTSVGMGARWEDRYWQARWDSLSFSTRGWSINALELYTVWVLVQLWCRAWRGLHIKLRVDSEVARYILNKRDARNPRLYTMVRGITELSEEHGFFFSASYISSRANFVADALNREFPLDARHLKAFGLRQLEHPSFPRL